MATTTTKRGGIAQRLTDKRAGVVKNFTAKTEITVAGATYDETSLEAEIDSYLKAYAALAAAEATVTTARATVKAGEADAVRFDASLSSSLKGFYGADSPTLGDYGMNPSKARPPLSSQEALTRATKAAHTRELRGTKSTKQKAAIKSLAAVNISTTLAPAVGTIGPAPVASTPSPAAPTPVAAAPTPAANAPTPAAAPAVLTPEAVHG